MLIVLPYTCLTSFASPQSVAEKTDEKVFSLVFVRLRLPEKLIRPKTALYMVRVER